MVLLAFHPSESGKLGGFQNQLFATCMEPSTTFLLAFIALFSLVATKKVFLICTINFYHNLYLMFLMFLSVVITNTKLCITNRFCLYSISVDMLFLVHLFSNLVFDSTLIIC